MLRKVLIAFAALAAFYLVATNLFVMVAPNFLCEVKKQIRLASPNGAYLATFQQVTCPPGRGDSRGHVEVATTEKPNHLIQVFNSSSPTVNVTMNWLETKHLVLDAPRSAPAPELNSNPYDRDVIVLLHLGPPLSQTEQSRLLTGRNIWIQFSELRSQFRNWLLQNQIAFFEESIDGRDLTLWSESDTERIVRWPRLAEEPAGAELVRKESSSTAYP